MDFKVKCVKAKEYPQYFTVGKVYDVTNGVIRADNGEDFSTWSEPLCGKDRGRNIESLKSWFGRWYEFELVEEKKVFTKSDLKTGMFGVMDNGFKFVVVNDIFVYSNGEWDKVSSFEDDLTATWKKVMKVFERVQSFFHLEYALDHDDHYAKLVYDRERDTKKLYNGKVVCVDLNGYNKCMYTVGKIYEFKNGCITCDDGYVFGEDTDEKFYTFEDWAEFTSSKFIEVVE